MCVCVCVCVSEQTVHTRHDHIPFNVPTTTVENAWICSCSPGLLRCVCVCVCVCMCVSVCVYVCVCVCVSVSEHLIEPEGTGSSYSK